MPAEIFADGDQDYIEKFNTVAQQAFDGDAAAGRLDDHIDGTADKHAASAIVNTPAGGIAATDVQAAINELDTEKQPIDATLTALAGVTTAADKLIYATGSDTFATTDLTSAGRALMDDADASAQRTTLGLGTAATLASDTDTSLAANSDTRLATQKAVKAYVDALIAASDAVVFRGVTDCSANPNYPAADAGHLYIVSVAGKIGGASGVTVEAGDMFICKVDSTASGNQATVGANWGVIQTNINGALTTADLGVTVAALAGSAFTGASSITLNSATAGLTITQNGAGQAISTTGGITAGSYSGASLSLAKNISYSGSLGSANALLFADGNASGSASGTLAPLNMARINSDTVDASDAGAIVDGLHVYHNFGGAGTVGGRAATHTTLRMVAETDNTSNAQRQYVVALQIGQAEANDGGTATTSPLAAGAIYGSNPNVRLLAAATNWYGLFGTEVNVSAMTGSSVAHKSGVVVVQTSLDDVQGSESDAAILIGNQIGAPGWDMGFAFGRSDGTWPIRSTGTLLGTYEQLYDTPVGAMEAACGVDFSAVTFSAYAFKSIGFSVSGAGAVAATSFTGPLTGNVTGNVSGSAGSVAAANLTGATLAAGVTASSLTSVGTLGALAVSGTITNSSILAPTTGTVSLGNATNGVSFVAEDAGSTAVNHWSAFGSATGARPTLRARSTTAVSANIQNGVAAPIILSTNADSTAAEQLRINHTASTDRYVTITGGNGVSPAIGASAGALAVGNDLTIAGAVTSTGAATFGSGLANFLQIVGAGTGGFPLVYFNGTDANVNGGMSTKGTGGFGFYTQAAASLQVLVANTSSANRYMTLTGSNGGNPTIGASAGGIQFSAIPIPPSYTVGTLPAVGTAGGMIYVSNETGGAVQAFSDGTNWRRVTDRAIVS